MWVRQRALARPAGRPPRVPSSVSLMSDHLLVGLRGVTLIVQRSSSSRLIRLSIHPKQQRLAHDVVIRHRFDARMLLVADEPDAGARGVVLREPPSPLFPCPHVERDQVPGHGHHLVTRTPFLGRPERRVRAPSGLRRVARSQIIPPLQRSSVTGGAPDPGCADHPGGQARQLACRGSDRELTRRTNVRVFAGASAYPSSTVVAVSCLDGPCSLRGEEPGTSRTRRAGLMDSGQAIAISKRGKTDEPAAPGRTAPPRARCCTPCPSAARGPRLTGRSRPPRRRRPRGSRARASRR